MTTTDAHPNSITTTMQRERTRRDEYVNGLRALADFIERRPDVPLPSEARVARHYFNRDDFLSAVRALGAARKDYSGAYAEVSRSFGPHELAFQILRDEVCEAVVVGTEKVMVPDPNAPKVEKEREIVEWRCHPLLAEAAA